MILAQSLFTLVFATHAAAIALNNTASEPKSKLFSPLRPVSGTLHLDPLPNPYPVPASTISLLFAQHQNIPLTKVNVEACFAETRRAILVYIRDHGDRPISHMYTINIVCRGVEFRIISAQPPNGPLMFNDTFAVVDGMSAKMSREGYWQWGTQVFRTDGNDYLGDAFMVRSEMRRMENRVL